MKKKFVPVLLTAMLLTLTAGCTPNQPSLSEKAETNSEENTEYADSPFTSWLPQGIEQVMSETAPNEDLKQLIIDYYEIPEDYWEETRYYYNYVDLDEDGADEIFAVIIGDYTSGTGGDSALWCSAEGGKLKIRQAFTLVSTPVIITKEAANDGASEAKGLIMQRRGEAEPEIVQLTCKDGIYTNVTDALVFENLDGVEGTAILCNDLIEDMENGTCLTLAD